MKQILSFKLRHDSMYAEPVRVYFRDCAFHDYDKILELRQGNLSLVMDAVDIHYLKEAIREWEKEYDSFKALKVPV